MATGLGLLASPTWAAGFSLTSRDIPANSVIDKKFVFNGFGCTGDNVSPQLSWSDPPAGTKGFAILVHDPDAPTGGSGWWHWVVINLPASLRSLEPGGLRPGTRPPVPGFLQIKTDYGVATYGGPCPPVGDKPHRYVFTVYALKEAHLQIPEGATAALVGYMVNANSLAKASFTAFYGRTP
jgi:Raf kinase inhibitor-like YbhB/YbcL family protein